MMHQIVKNSEWGHLGNKRWKKVKNMDRISHLRDKNTQLWDKNFEYRD